VAVSCSDYQQRLTATNSLWSVRAVTDRGDVSDCRLISRVDSNDSLSGCGLTVQATVEECLRYQVTFAGGDTLLMNGPVGEAYDCSGRSAAPRRLRHRARPQRRRRPRPRLRESRRRVASLRRLRSKPFRLRAFNPVALSRSTPSREKTSRSTPQRRGRGGPDLAPSRLGRRASSSATNSVAPVGRYLNPTAQLRSTILTCPRRSERTAVVRPTGGVLPEGGLNEGGFDAHSQSVALRY